MGDYLAFVKKIGDTLDGQNIYQFMFTTVPDVVWGENFNIIPAGIIPNLVPDNNCLSRKGRVVTDIDFFLACESTCFSMMDAIDGVIALCFTEPGVGEEIIFHFNEAFETVLEKLRMHSLELTELEDVKIEDEDDIIDGAIKRLETEQEGEEGEDENTDDDDIW